MPASRSFWESGRSRRRRCREGIRSLSAGSQQRDRHGHETRDGSGHGCFRTGGRQLWKCPAHPAGDAALFHPEHGAEFSDGDGGGGRKQRHRQLFEPVRGRQILLSGRSRQRHAFDVVRPRAGRQTGSALHLLRRDFAGELGCDRRHGPAVGTLPLSDAGSRARRPADDERSKWAPNASTIRPAGA